MKACYVEEIRAVDKAATEIGGIPSIVLMENAANACFEEIVKDFKDINNKRIAIFCGKGNNGGDGFALARRLCMEGCGVSVYLVCGTDFKGDAKINYDIIKNMDIDIDVIGDTDNLKYIIRASDIVVDAIYGTGIHGSVTGIGYDVIKEINENGDYVLSVDVPSGINSDTGEVCGICVKATKTVTFAAYKVGMLLFPAADYVGEVIVKDISIPDYIIEGQNISVNVTDDDFIKNNFPRRENNSQKGDYGKLLIIAGSEGMSGAAYLAAQTAVRAGSGLVTLAAPDCINAALEAKTTEAMTLPLASMDGHISFLATDKILTAMEKADAVLIGPGLGRSQDAFKILKTVLKAAKVPVIIDADGINLAAENMDMIKECECPLIFTPHAVEMSRLTGLGKDYIEENRLAVSRDFAESYGATVILKGHRTVVTDQSGEQYINITGNPGLATGGSGDVLAGIISSFVARGINETVASAMAVYIHGKAGDISKEKIGIEGVIASNVMENISDAMKILLVD